MARTHYDVILKDLCRDHPKFWTSAIRKDIQTLLGQYIKGSIAHSPTLRGTPVRCWWRSNKLLVENDELVVYFLPRKSNSIVTKKVGMPTHNDVAGLTGWYTYKKGAMICEVFIEDGIIGIEGIPQSIIRSLAHLAFHEIMHNKLDTHPHLQVMKDVHKLGGVAEKPSHSSVPTLAHKKTLGKHLHLRINQYTGQLFSDAVGGLG